MNDLERVLNDWIGAELGSDGFDTTLESLWGLAFPKDQYNPKGIERLLDVLRRDVYVHRSKQVQELRDKYFATGEFPRTVRDLCKVLDVKMEVERVGESKARDRYSASRQSNRRDSLRDTATQPRDAASKRVSSSREEKTSSGLFRGDVDQLKRGPYDIDGPISYPVIGDKAAANAPTLSGAAPVNFTVYYYSELTPGAWHPLLAYAHVFDAAAQVERDSQHQVYKRASLLNRARSKANTEISRGTEITVVPKTRGCTFNPERSSFMWLEDWHRIEFRMQASPNLKSLIPRPWGIGRVSFYVGPLLVAEVPITVNVLAAQGSKLPGLGNTIGSSDVLGAPDKKSTNGSYEKVFVSYSHRDSKIVEGLEKAYAALGINYLRDVKLLRSGDKWNPVLLRKIDQADKFQLCWSKAARKSPYVGQELRYALALNRHDFIHPFYWQKPMPAPPPELSSVHFAYYEP